MTEHLNDYPQISNEAAQAAGFNTGDYGPTTHYAQVDGGTLQVPEMASTVAVNRGGFDELDDRSPDGRVITTRFPDAAGNLQTWVKQGVGQDKYGQDRVVIANPNTNIFTTVPADQFSKARLMNKERQTASEVTMPLGRLVLDTQIAREPYVDNDPRFAPRQHKVQ